MSDGDRRSTRSTRSSKKKDEPAPVPPTASVASPDGHKSQKRKRSEVSTLDPEVTYEGAVEKGEESNSVSSKKRRVNEPAVQHHKFCIVEEE